MSLVLGAGALIGFERGNRDIAALVEATRRRREKILTSSGSVAQAWRQGGSRQALLSRLLPGVEERSLGPEVSRRIGELCAEATSNDVVGAHVALLAGTGDVVLTSDVEDLRRFLRALGSTAQLEAV